MGFFNNFFIYMAVIPWLMFLEEIMRKISIRSLICTVDKAFFSKPSTYLKLPAPLATSSALIFATIA